MSRLLTDEQAQYLAEHRWAVLATGRADGSPQVSQIGYDWNGRDIAISVKSYTAKWKNARRQPRVALLVHDGRQQLVIYGEAECVSEDPRRTQLTARVFARLMDNPDFTADEAFVRTLNEQQRTVLRLVPQKVFMNE